ncbi:MAG: uroporphyrinogen-III synthase [Acidimicrobiales bacterium]
MDAAPLEGMTIGITAERRAAEQADLFRRRGAEAVFGPAMRSVVEGHDEALHAATVELIRRPPDFVLASTGFGMRTWFAAADRAGLKAELLAALSRARVANRGAKAASANIAAGLEQWWRAPGERFEELVERVLEEDLAGNQVAVQLHGGPMPEAVARLEAAGASVVQIDAYRARMPADTGPARQLIDAACDGHLAAVTFTAAPAVHNLFAIAAQAGREDDLRRALNGPVVAGCVGPVCAKGAVEEGIEAPVVPAQARLVPLVQAVTDSLAERS